MHKVTKEIESNVMKNAVQANTLINTLTKLSGKKYPHPSFIDLRKLQHLTPESAAENLRTALGLGAITASDYIYSFERLGIRVIFIKLPEKISGFFNKLPSEPFYTIYINSQDCPERKLFSLAQITGHIIYCQHSEDDEEELINDFAAAFLMPKKAIFEQLNYYLPESTQINFKLLNIIKTTFKVSAQALLYRIYSLSLINKTHLKSMEKQIINYYKNNDFQEPAPQSPSLFENKAISLLFNSIKNKELLFEADEIIKKLSLLKIIIPFTGEK